MIDRNTFARCSAAALVAAAMLTPAFAEAGSCAGPRVAWTKTSNAEFNLQCGTFANRGRSFGAVNTQPGSPIKVPQKLSVELLIGLHASGIPYNALGDPITGCNPIDQTTGDGAKSVSGIGCLGGSTHQVLVVF